MKVGNLLVLLCLLQACTCNNKRPTITIPDVASESVKEIFVERLKEHDSIPPSPESEAHTRDLIERSKRSEYSGLKDADFEKQLRGWVAEFSSSCDTAVFNRFKNAISKDLNFQAWVRKNHALKEELWVQMKAVRDSCNAKR